MMIKKVIVAALFSLPLLSACQSAPDPVHLNPQLDTTASGHNITLRVRDQRAHNHVMRLKTGDQTAEFATADPSLASLISERVAERWTVVDEADAQLEVIIRDALFVIQQGSLRHDTEHNIRLQAKLTTPQVEMEKGFAGNRESNGPLRADIKKIEREFGDLLASVLNELVNDDTISRRIEEAQ